MMSNSTFQQLTAGCLVFYRKDHAQEQLRGVVGKIAELKSGGEIATIALLNYEGPQSWPTIRKTSPIFSQEDIGKVEVTSGGTCLEPFFLRDGIHLQ